MSAPDGQDHDERHFVEEVGLLFAEMGAPRMMGRILGRLLVCDPPHQTAGELATYLEASAGSISTITRQLVTGGMIERVARPGERATSFRIRPGVWVELMRRRMHFLTQMRETADRGLALFADAPPSRVTRLREFRDFYAFVEGVMPQAIDRWAAGLDRDPTVEDR